VIRDDSQDAQPSSSDRNVIELRSSRLCEDALGGGLQSIFISRMHLRAEAIFLKLPAAPTHRGETDMAASFCQSCWLDESVYRAESLAKSRGVRQSFTSGSESLVRANERGMKLLAGTPIVARGSHRPAT